MSGLKFELFSFRCEIIELQSLESIVQLRAPLRPLPELGMAGCGSELSYHK